MRLEQENGIRREQWGMMVEKGRVEGTVGEGNSEGWREQ